MNAPVSPRRRTGRRAPPQQVFDTSVPSPCLQLCGLDESGQACSGCGRTLEELRNWSLMSREAKLSVWERLGRDPFASET